MPRILTLSKGAPGLSEPEAIQVFDHIAQFASYGFNKSHAAAYAAVAFETAVLREDYDREYFASVMNFDIGEVTDIAMDVSALKKRDIPLLKPHINMCTARFRPIQGNAQYGIAYGLSALRGVGADAAASIDAEREKNGPYTSFENFKKRVGAEVGKKAMVALICAGAFDSMIESRADAVALAEDRTRQANVNQLSMFDLVPEIDTRTAKEEWSAQERLDREFDAVGFWLSAHPLDSFRPTHGAAPMSLLDDLRHKHKLPRAATIVASVVDFKIRGTKSGGLMGVLLVSDSKETYELVAFDDTWNGIRSIIKKKESFAFTVSPMSDASPKDLRLMITGAAPYVAPKVKARAQKAA